MLQRFQKIEIDRVGSQYSGDTLFRAIESSCQALMVEFESMVMTPEEVFNSVLTILDDLKEKPQDYYTHKIPGLWMWLLKEYRQLYNTSSKDEIQNLATILVGIEMQLISYSSIPFYGTRVKNALMGCLLAQGEYLKLDKLSPILAKLESCRSDLEVWIDDYMDSDTFRSDEINTLIHPEKKKRPARGRSKTPLFFDASSSKKAADDFRSKLKDAGLVGNLWTSSANDPISILLLKWRKAWLSDIDPSTNAKALVDFAIDMCGVVTDRDRRAIANAIRPLL